MLAAVVTALRLVTVHGPDGQVIELNPDAVVSLRVPRGNEQHFGRDIHCLVFTSDGKFSGVVEDCATVQRKLKE